MPATPVEFALLVGMIASLATAAVAFWYAWTRKAFLSD